MKKMRLFYSILATIAMFFAASTAGALSFHVVGLSSSGGSADLATRTVNATPADAGATVTVDILIQNINEDGVAVLGLSLNNWEGGVADFSGGNSSTSVLNAICSGGSCFGGIPNATQPTLVFDVVNNENVVNAVAAAASADSAGNGNTDVSAIDDTMLTGDAGQAHARVTFSLTGLTGTSVIGIGKVASFDAVSNAGGESIPTINTDLTINVVPEPGTVLLMGLGLAGLAAAGRRED